MSYSVCLSCEEMVPGYEKYCVSCLKRFPHLRQVAHFWKDHAYTLEAAKELAKVEKSNKENTMQAHQQRVVDEKKELDDKLGKLLAFIDAGKGPTFSTLVTEERERLTTQARIMREYSDILADRIAAF